jgi:hypothetical protein
MCQCPSELYVRKQTIPNWRPKGTAALSYLYLVVLSHLLVSCGRQGNGTDISADGGIQTHAICTENQNSTNTGQRQTLAASVRRITLLRVQTWGQVEEYKADEDVMMIGLDVRNGNGNLDCEIGAVEGRGPPARIIYTATSREGDCTLYLVVATAEEMRNLKLVLADIPSTMPPEGRNALTIRGSTLMDIFHDSQTSGEISGMEYISRDPSALWRERGFYNQ